MKQASHRFHKSTSNGRQAGREDLLVHPSFVEGKILLSQALNDVEEMEIALRDFL